MLFFVHYLHFNLNPIHPHSPHHHHTTHNHLFYIAILPYDIGSPGIGALSYGLTTIFTIPGFGGGAVFIQSGLLPYFIAPGGKDGEVVLSHTYANGFKYFYQLVCVVGYQGIGGIKGFDPFGLDGFGYAVGTGVETAVVVVGVEHYTDGAIDIVFVHRVEGV